MSNNDLVSLMKEFGVEAVPLGRDDRPTPEGMAMGAMLTEIHRLRTTVAAAEPHIRRKVLEELIAEAEQGDLFPFGTGVPVAMNDDLAGWLSSKLPVEP